MGRRTRRLAIPVSASVVVAAVAVWQLWFPGRGFDPVAWHDEAQVQQGARLGMADRLVARGRLWGKTRAEVVDLLGEPSATGDFHDWDLVYWLGLERSFISTDSEWLVLRLGPDDRVTDYRIARD